MSDKERRSRILHESYAGSDEPKTLMPAAIYSRTSAINSALLHVDCVNLQQQPKFQQRRTNVCLRLKMSRVSQQHIGLV